jgi:hypothetical protein
MPDLTGFPALDVAIGLAFLYFMLSTICSLVNESIAAFFGWRAKTLEDALASMLGDPTGKSRLRKILDWIVAAVKPKPQPKPKADEGKPNGSLPDDLAARVLKHWAVKGLVRDPQSRWRRRNKPSYLPPDVVSLAVVDVLKKNVTPDAGDATAWAKEDRALFSALTGLIKQIPIEDPRRLLLQAATKAGDKVEDFRKEIEAAFNDTMERATGWYKRKTQAVIFLIAIAVTVALNINTVKIATRLWNDEPLRTGVTAAAIQAVSPSPGAQTSGSSSASGTGGAVAIAQASGTGSKAPTAAEKAAAASKAAADKAAADKAAKACAPVSDAPGAPPADPAACIKQKADAAAAAISKVKQLGLPIGWDKANKPKASFGLAAGWLLTILAVSLGAPFWFDTLNRLVRLRGSGVPSAPDTSGAVGQPAPTTTTAPLAAGAAEGASGVRQTRPRRG